MDRIHLSRISTLLVLAVLATAHAAGDQSPPAAQAPAEAARQTGPTDPLGSYLDQVRAQRRAQHERLRAESRSEGDRVRRDQREAAEEHRRAHREQTEQWRDASPPGPPGLASPPGRGTPWYFQGW